jgi:hypothetical protein
MEIDSFVSENGKVNIYKDYEFNSFLLCHEEEKITFLDIYDLIFYIINKYPKSNSWNNMYDMIGNDINEKSIQLLERLDLINDYNNFGILDHLVINLIFNHNFELASYYFGKCEQNNKKDIIKIVLDKLYRYILNLDKIEQIFIWCRENNISKVKAKYLSYPMKNKNDEQIENVKKYYHLVKLYFEDLDLNTKVEIMIIWGDQYIDRWREIFAIDDATDISNIDQRLFDLNSSPEDLIMYNGTVYFTNVDAKYENCKEIYKYFKK